MSLTLKEARWHIASCLLHPRLSVSARTNGRREALGGIMLGSLISIDTIRGYVEKSEVLNEIEFWNGYLDVIEMDINDIKALWGGE